MQYYIATIFLLHGLSPLPIVAFGFIIATAALLASTLSNPDWIQRACFRLDDALFAGIYVLGLLPFYFNPMAVGTQNAMHSMLWLGTWSVSFWWIREWLIVSKLTFEKISNAAAVGCVALSVAILLEFVLANVTGLYLSDFFYFSIDEFPPANVLGDTFLRPRGFAAEAGFTSIAFECLIPLSIVWVARGRMRRVLFTLIVLPAYLLLFSAASISCLVVTWVVYMMLDKGLWYALSRAAVVLGLIVVAFLLSADFSFLVNEIFIRKYLELLPGSLGASADTFSRAEAYSLALDIMRERPFGIGWGGVSQQYAAGQALVGVDLKGSGLISFPLEVAASAGLIGLCLYCVVVYRKLCRLARLSGRAVRLTFISMLWVSLHHVFLLELWFPMIWFCMALADVLVIRATVPAPVKIAPHVHATATKL